MQFRPDAKHINVPRDGLRGMYEICQYAGLSEKKVRQAIKTMDFPARILFGRWESSRTMIDEWRRGLLRQ